jgi:hypothetical protein
VDYKILGIKYLPFSFGWKLIFQIPLIVPKIVFFALLKAAAMLGLVTKNTQNWVL